jgi:transcriptional repressor NrdR
MANFVIKKDGQKEPFDPEKIRKAISMAADQAGIAEERKNEIVEQVTTSTVQMADTKEEVTTTEIREKILNELNVIEPSVTEAWRKYEQEKGRV